ncbi:MAG: glycosyltransferase family 9 protein [Ignavibacteria bacterium]|nr:glycosyltransferase family 9 protein [Ignavibacteria bacterium]
MKILIVQIGRYGDMILTTPMFREIHRVFPEAEIHVLASHRNYHIIEHHPRITKVWVYSKKLRSIFHLLSALRNEKFDYWIDPKDHFSREGSLLAALSGAKVKIGYNGLKGRSFTQPLSMSLPDTFHQSEVNTAALELIGIHVESSRPELYPDDNSEQYVLQTIGANAPYVVVNLSSGNKSRALPFEMWNAICAEISQPVFLNCLPHDAVLASKLEAGNSSVHCVESRSIMDTVSLISHARLLISPDTAAIHIASAFDVSTIGFYPAIDWNYNKFRPLCAHSAVLMPDKETENIKDIPLYKIRATIELFAF